MKLVADFTGCVQEHGTRRLWHPSIYALADEINLPAWEEPLIPLRTL